MLRALTLVAVLLPAPPAYAAIDSNLITHTLDGAKVNIDECPDQTWAYKADVVVNLGKTNADSDYALEFGTNCNTETDPSEATYTDCTPGGGDCCEQLKSGSMAVPAATSETQTISGDVKVSEIANCDGVGTTSFQFVLKLESFDSDGSEQEYSGTTVNVEVDLERPGPPPDSPGVAADETIAEITWDSATHTEEHIACVFRGSFDPALPISDQSLDNKTCSGKETDGTVGVTDLQVGLTYTAVLARYDEAGNESLPSDPTTFTTEEVTDFYELYRTHYGGGDPGGYCATTPGGAAGGGMGFVLLCLVGLGLSWRPRRRAMVALLGASVLLLAAAPASAESPKFMTFEFRIGQWLPNVDGEFDGLDSLGIAGPYETMFGDDTATVVDLEFAAHVYQGYGTGSLGVGLGRGSVSAKGIKADDTRGTGDTTLSIFPLSLFASYAFDWPAERWGFPLVPYGKLGVDWVLYDLTDAQDETSTVSGTVDEDGAGEGGTVGWHWALGARLLLDALSPEMARTFDLDMGVNNSYLFLEYYDATIDDFGDDNALHLGAEVLFRGLAYKF